MKSNRILQIVLVVLIVAFAAAAGFLYKSNSSEVNRQKVLKDTLNQKQTAYNSGLTQKTALEKTATDLANQLASAKALLANTYFRSSSESIEYDRILYTIADSAKLRLINITASPPSAFTEQNNNYQVTTFTVTVEGLSPDGIFATSKDDADYITAVINNILAFSNAIAISPDFDTAIIQPVNINVPRPMRAVDIQAEIDGINNKIASELKDAIDALTVQIQTDNADTLTQDQIAGLVKTETDKLVAETLKAKSADEVKMLVEQAGIESPSATITINIWTYKGA
jgi:cell division protein FtsB